MPYTAVIAMIGGLTIIGVPPTSGFMSEWILFAGALQTAVHDADPARAILFGFGILTTILSSAYILWMYKRIFFGKIPERLVNVTDSNRYITVTMAVLAGLTLILGVYPDPILNPITSYIESIFPPNSGVLQLPASHSTDMPGERPGTQEKSTSQPSSVIYNSNDPSGTYIKPTRVITPPAEGGIYGEDNRKDSYAKIEYAVTVYNIAGASK
jgi:hypothetical protein